MEWKKLHNEELHNLYTSFHVIYVIKSGMTGRECSIRRTTEWFKKSGLETSRKI